MKNNWLKVVDFDDKYGFTYDNLAILLDFFFDGFVFEGYDDNKNIVVRKIDDNKKYVIRKDNNNLRMKINYDEGKGSRLIDRSLELYRYYISLDECDLCSQKSLQIIYKASSKLAYNSKIDLIKDRINIFDALVNIDSNNQRSVTLSCNSDIFNAYDINTKYGYPDLSYGVKILRNSNKTIIKRGYYNNGISCFSGYYNTNNSVPIAEIAASNMHSLREEKQSVLSKKIPVNKRKIGF